MIEKVTADNLKEFNNLLSILWKGATLQDCLKDAQQTAQFMFKENNKYVGLITCSIKTDYVEGCKSNKVGYIEGIYVLPAYRRKKVATKLIEHFEKWAKEIGVTELASDCELSNEISKQFHEKNGYKVVKTLIHFKKEI